MFSSARLKLTSWYLLIILFISLSFSLVIYRVSTLELERFDRVQRFRIERRLNEGGPHLLFLPFIDQELVAETKRRLMLRLLAINGGIVIISGAVGYLLAGRTLQPIKEMVEKQNRFVADASHELRTPLTSLKTAIEVSLRDQNLSLKEAKKIISGNLKEVDKLQLLTDRLLQLSSGQEITAKMNFESLSLAKIAEEAIARIEPLAQKKKIRLKSKIKNCRVKGDRGRLVELLVILLDNAVKYSPVGEPVEISSLKEKGRVMVAVRDWGLGIEAKDLPHIFDRFYRADAARSQNQAGGYGLGLPIAKMIAEAHQGTITVRSKLNEGSTFIVCLPARHASTLALAGGTAFS